MKLPVWAYAAAVLTLLGVGFLAGRASAWVDPTPALEAEKQLRATKASFDSLLRADSLARIDLQAERTGTAAERARLYATISRLEARTSVLLDRADSLGRALTTATSPRDSIRILVAQAAACSEGARACVASRDSLKRVATMLERDTLSLRSELNLIDRDRTAAIARVETAERVAADLRKAVQGCRLIGPVKCPAATLEYAVDRRAISIGASYPLRAWLRIGVTWDVLQGAPSH